MCACKKEQPLYLLGIDTGTTNTKVGIFDLDGREIALKKSPTPSVSKPFGEAEFNPDAIWENLTHLIKSLPERYRRKVKALSISSFAETVYPLDAKKRPLDNGIAWFDKRTVPQVEEVKKSFGSTAIRKITGVSPSWVYSLNKILWFREEKPRLYEKTKLWLDNAGYIIFKLTGEKVIDYSLACRTMMFDLWQKKWSEDILEKFHIDPATLPEPVPSGILIGKLTKKASEETGLNRETHVVSGGHDHLCAALSVGAIKEGKILDSAGSAECILAATKKTIEKDKLVTEKNFTMARHVVKDTFCFLTGVYSGLLFNWLTHNLLKQKSYSIINKAQFKEKSPLFIPHIAGSRTGIMSGAIFGLKDFHTREHIIFSGMESIVFEVRKIVDGIERIIDRSTSSWKVRTVGGGAKNKLLLGMKASLLEKVVEIPVIKEATCHGAALLAGIGAGFYKDETEAVGKTFKISEVYNPDPELSKKLKEKYSIYCKIVEKYREIEKLLPE